jgi:hypothetical protein
MTTVADRQPRQFDLNIERVLENWTVTHALREVIANALDEQALTGTTEPAIVKDTAGVWHIRDFGRGIKYQHLTQNENPEKLRYPELVVGKFGVGLKDALATFDRHSIRICIRSCHGDITTGKAAKHGFDEIRTLHAVIGAASAPDMTGTDIAIEGVRDEDVDNAKALFLRYADDAVIEETTAGAILKRGSGPAPIYVNGLRVAEEENFLFGYNVTSMTKRLRAALNRERSNVGRSAYTDRVKAILLAATSAEATGALAADLGGYQTGRWHDETQWVDVAVHACQVLNAHARVVFVTPGELSVDAGVIGQAQLDGYRPVVVPETLSQKLRSAVDIIGLPIRDLGNFIVELNASFKFSFVDPDDLSPDERAVYEATGAILTLRGGQPREVKEITISETMRPEIGRFETTYGVWERELGRIVIKRDQLRSLNDYAGTLLHEVAHAVSGAGDVTRQFEDTLTEELGAVAAVQVDLPVASPNDRAHALDDWLRTRLANGPQPARGLRAALRDQGYAESEVRTAKRRLRIRSTSASPSHANTWLWSLGQATSGDAGPGVGN